MSLILSAVGLSVVMVAWAVWFKKALSQAVPSSVLGFAIPMILGLGLVSAAFAFETSLLGVVIATIALVLGTFWLVSTALGAQKTAEPTIAVGQPLPEFSASNEDGSAFHSGEMNGAPYLLKFFRGHW